LRIHGKYAPEVTAARLHGGLSRYFCAGIVDVGDGRKASARGDPALPGCQTVMSVGGDYIPVKGQLL
jgi:hypothetical protein